MPTPLTFESRITLLCTEDVEELDIAEVFEVVLNKLNPEYYNKLIIACQEQRGFNHCMDNDTSAVLGSIKNGKIILNQEPAKIIYSYIGYIFSWATARKNPEVGINFGVVRDSVFKLVINRNSLFTDIIENYSQTATIAKHLQNRSNYSRQDLSKYYTPEQLYEAYAGYKSREECLELWTTSTEKQL